MAMNFDIPDIRENASKAVIGNKMRKPRKVGDLRLGDTMRSISHHYTCTEERVDEDAGTSFYSLSEGEKNAKFYGFDVTPIGVCLYRKKAAAIYMELPSSMRPSLLETLQEKAGSMESSSQMDMFVDTVTSIFVTKPGKGENVFTVALMDSEAAKALSDQAAVEATEKEQAKGPLSRFFSTFFDPVGRISRKSYIPKMLLMGIPATILFSFTCLKPELFVGDLNFYIVSFLILGTLCFISLISLGMRRLSDLGLSHLYYWGFFAILFAINQLGGEFLGSQLMATRVIAVIFMIAIILLAFFPGQNKKNKYGPVPKD
ncbi:MAG TPA: hypothetical protein DDY92_03815 [Dialister sp.]|nr:hypothetical protein [Dialister sp.]